MYNNNSKYRNDKNNSNNIFKNYNKNYILNDFIGIINNDFN